MNKFKGTGVIKSKTGGSMNYILDKKRFASQVAHLVDPKALMKMVTYMQENISVIEKQIGNTFKYLYFEEIYKYLLSDKTFCSKFPYENESTLQENIVNAFEYLRNADEKESYLSYNPVTGSEIGNHGVPKKSLETIIYNKYGDKNTEAIFDTLDQESLRQQIKLLFLTCGLSNRESDILDLYYELHVDEDLHQKFNIIYDQEYSLDTIGDFFSLHPERIRQIMARGIQKIKREYSFGHVSKITI